MKKHWIFLLLLFTTVITAYYFYIPAISPPAPNNGDIFIFGAIQSYNDGANNYSNYNAIGLNGMHTYNGTGYTATMQRHTPMTNIGTGDSLTAVNTSYSGAIITAMQNLANNGSGYLFFMQKAIL